MLAVISRQYGGPEVLSLEETEAPRPGADQVLVEVKASSINPVDNKIRQGDFKMLTGKQPPAILGGDFAGVVIDAGPQAGLQPGDEVFGLTNYFKGGAFAQQLVAGPEMVALKPKNLSFAEAAALPLTGQTALQALVSQAKIKHGERVLVNGCGGGVGVMALQVAKAYGSMISGVCSQGKFELARSLGAADLIDYQKGPLPSLLAEYDLIFDCIGNLPFGPAQKHLAHGGRYVSTQAGLLGMLWLPPRNLVFAKKRLQVMVESRLKDLNQLALWVEEGTLRPVIAQVYPFTEVLQAVQASEEGHVAGKLVLTWD
ncbi:MAG: NAD(P)-dependent alcohol dehydrogenase [bacterium]|nr:NAD(P)-dependent alcohol dehydrogenase [bacterium]